VCISHLPFMTGLVQVGFFTDTVPPFPVENFGLSGNPRSK